METPNTMDNIPPPEEHEQRQGDEYSRSGKGKFRFKSSKSKSRSHRDEPYDSHHHRHHHHHRTSKRHKSRHASPAPEDNPPALSPDAAFRESLFDALGDDEGAAYWESVYGQPIHKYAVPAVPKGPNGELEQMSDEEYAAYVRRRMWERTREGMLEEQERERQQQQKKRDRAEAERGERMRFERAMEESLQRGRERRRLKAWRSIWDEYRCSWEDINGEVAAATAAGGSERKRFRDLVFWPVESGKRRDISREAVEEFMRRVPVEESQADDDRGKDDTSNLLGILKAERIRWHPDKIQHRYGALGIDEAEMRSVTEVFQIIDQMWNETRVKQS